LVKTSFSDSMFVANPDGSCTAEPDTWVTGLNVSAPTFVPIARPFTAFPGADSGVHTANPLQYPAGDAATFSVTTRSLQDMGDYEYVVSVNYCQYTDSSGDYICTTTTSETFDFAIDNTPAEASPSFTGTPRVGSTVTLDANASDPDHPGTALTHFDWSLSGPQGGQATLSATNIANPTIHFGDKHDIGTWTVRLDVGDVEGELTHAPQLTIDVPNQPPTVSIMGATDIQATGRLQLTAGPPTDPDGEDVTFEWTLTGYPPQATPPATTVSGDSIDWPMGPTAVGDWSFEVVATDEHGATATADIVVHVEGVPPTIQIAPASDAIIHVGDHIYFEDTQTTDAYGDPIASYSWDLTQVPISAGVGLVSGFETGAILDRATSPEWAGTWKLTLTVTDQTGETASADVKVLVDAPPQAVIVGPDVTGNLTLPLQLDGTSSVDPDSPGGPPDFGHLHTGPVDVSPGIVAWQWTIIDAPSGLDPSAWLGTVDDVFHVTGTSATLDIPSGRVPEGNWHFQLEVRDGEGNGAVTDKWVQVLDEGLPPLVVISPSFLPALVSGTNNVDRDVRFDGSASFDPDNLLHGPYSPGLGITSYAWSIPLGPPLCGAIPSLPSGATATTATLFSAGTLVDPTCQGGYIVALTLTDDDVTPRTRTGTALALIGNCAGNICIDAPTQAMPQYVTSSNRTDVLVYYHLNSALYAVAQYQYGLRVEMIVTPQLDPMHPFFTAAWDVDLLPSDQGGVLIAHWKGFGDDGHRPEPGKYDLTLQLVDPNGVLTADRATESQSIWIQTVTPVVDSADTLVGCNGLAAGTDTLSVTYHAVGGLPGLTTPYDEAVLHVYAASDHHEVAQASFSGSPPPGTLSWNGDTGVGFLPPGAYLLAVELRSGGASLGKSNDQAFRAYKLGLSLAGVAAPDRLDPGLFLNVGDTADLTVRLDTDATTLTGSVEVKQDNLPGTLSALDGMIAADLVAGYSVATSSLAAPKVLTLKAEKPAGDVADKATITATYLPSGAPANKKAVDQVGVTVPVVRLDAAGADPARKASDGIFLGGDPAAPAVTTLNVDWLKYRMRPVSVRVSPDVSGATVTLDYASGGAANLELYDAAAGHAAVSLPVTWHDTDFSAHKLSKDLLAYGEAFGEVVLTLTYKKGATTIGQDQVKVRVSPPVPLTGVGTGGVFPLFRPVRTVNAGSRVTTALDPFRHKERIGRRAAVYLVAHKTSDQWALDPSLVDVAGGPVLTTLDATSIASNFVSTAPVAVPGAYDVVYDFGNFADDPGAFVQDARLDPGDILDSADPDPSVSVEGSLVAGAVATTTADFGILAPKTVAIPAGYDGLAAAFSFRLRGHLEYPSTILAKAPLVVIAHGNHLPLHFVVAGVTKTASANLTSAENFMGYDYLQHALATQGYITLSVDLDETYGDLGYPDYSGSGIQLRAWILLKNIENLLTDATIAGGALVGKIDTGHIYLLGHSRGGEAVIVANDLLVVPARAPGGASVAGFDATSIKGIVSLSPVTAQIEGAPVTPPAMPYLLLYGSADGDVNGATPGVRPFEQYDRAASNKFTIRLEGGDHNNFNTSWAYDDATTMQTGGTLTAAVLGPMMSPVGTGLVSGSDQRGFAVAYVGAFLAMVDRGDVGARAYFLEPPAALSPLGLPAGLSLHSQSRLDVPKFVLDDYESNPSTAIASSGQSVSFTVTHVAEDALTDADYGTSALAEGGTTNRFFQGTRGVLFDWTAPAEYVEQTGVLDLSTARYLSFRLAQQPKHPNTTAAPGPRTLSVELEDAVGNTSAIGIAILDSVEAIYQAFGAELYMVSGLSLAGSGCSDLAADKACETTSAAFKTFRVPIASFANEGRTLDLSHIARVRFKVASGADSPQGRVALDDVEVER
jgi:hypothetical protein